MKKTKTTITSKSKKNSVIPFVKKVKTTVVTKKDKNGMSKKMSTKSIRQKRVAKGNDSY